MYNSFFREKIERREKERKTMMLCFSLCYLFHMYFLFSLLSRSLLDINVWSRSIGICLFINHLQLTTELQWIWWQGQTIPSTSNEHFFTSNLTRLNSHQRKYGSYSFSLHYTFVYLSMPRKNKSSNEHHTSPTKKGKDKPTYKIIVLGSGGVGKVRNWTFPNTSSTNLHMFHTSLMFDSW